MPSRATVAAGRRRVREGSAQPRWLSRAVVEIIHGMLLREYGGSAGIREGGLLDSALTRARNKWAYGERDLAVLAAAYGFGLARNHAFVDGNKRIAFTVTALFLAMNDCDLDVPEPEVVDVMRRLAAGRITEAKFAEWVRTHMTRS